MPIESTAISRPRQEDLIPGYRLEAVVGKGGMGEVHKAKQLSLSRTVAVKLLASELAKDPAFVTRFEKEAAALATLQHPNIVSIVDKGHSGDTYFLVMEFVDGPSLREVMRQPTFEVPRALKIVWDICRAIEYAHSKGVIHRDLKPENILFDQQAGGIPKVSDFGLASFNASSGPSKFNVTETHVAMGTASYMAPEQRIDAKNVDGRADIYAMGVILYELLVGEVPVGAFTPPSVKRPEIDKRLDGIVDRCLKPSANERYAAMSELLAALEPLVPITTSLTPRKVTSATRIGMAVQRGVRTTMRAVAAVIIIAALAVLATAVLRSQNKHTTIELPGAAISAELPAQTPVIAKARFDNSDSERVIKVGQPPDTLPLVPFGRAVKLDGTAVMWTAPNKANDVGRLKLDASALEGKALSFSADVTTPPQPDDLKATLKRVILGYGPEPRAALLLTGDPGRYLALVTNGTGGPVSFEWALAEKRGTMLGPTSSKVMQVSLEIDKYGEARAFVGLGKDKRPLGEPVSLGKEWKKHFGRMPVAQLGCIDGECRFNAVTFEVEREAPMPPVQPPPVVENAVDKEPKKVEKAVATATKTTSVKQTSAKVTTTKSTSTKKGGKRRQK